LVVAVAVGGEEDVTQSGDILSLLSERKGERGCGWIERTRQGQNQRGEKAAALACIGWIWRQSKKVGGAGAYFSGEAEAGWGGNGGGGD
jgi:hypothetical protein